MSDLPLTGQRVDLDGDSVAWWPCHIGRDASIGTGCSIGALAHIGQRVTMGPGCKIQGAADIAAACSLGGARAAMEAAQIYMGERQQFGRKIENFQALQFKLADMATQLEAARLMVHRAADSLDNGAPETTNHCAMAKRLATDLGFEIANEALQIHGGYGYLKDFPMERIVRDLRVHKILEGTNEIMRVIIARKLLAAQ